MAENCVLERKAESSVLCYIAGTIVLNLLQIAVNGTSRSVMKSHLDANRYLSEIGVFHIWIDGICIDQNDLAKR